MIEVFFRLWTPLEKNADHTDAGYRQPFGLAHGSSPLSPTARSDQSLSPSANCSRSRFVVVCFRFGTILLVILIAVLQLQSGCGMREPEARSYNTTAGRVGAARE